MTAIYAVCSPKGWLWRTLGFVKIQPVDGDLSVDTAQSSIGNEMSILSSTGPQNWYRVAPFLASPTEGQGQGYCHQAPAGEEALMHHCKEACCPVHGPRYEQYKPPQLCSELFTNSSPHVTEENWCILPFVSLHLGNVSFSKSHWKKFHIDYIFHAFLLLLLSFCYKSPIRESTCIGCLLEIIDSDLHIICITFACCSFIIKNHRCLFIP